MAGPALRSPLTETQVEKLLCVVCVDLGLCLTPDTYEQLVTTPHRDAVLLTDAIFVADGMSPQTADRKLYGQVRACVEDAFSAVTASDDA
jgi:hypothetical protein